MAKAVVAWSTAANAEEAVAQAFDKALGELATKPSLAILFSTVDYDPAKVIKSARERIGRTPLWGGTTFTGILTPDGFISSPNGALGVMFISGIEAGAGWAPAGRNPRKNALKALKKATAKLPSPKAFLMPASPGIEERVIEAIAETYPAVPVVGGSAADNTIEGKWQVFGYSKIYPKGVNVAALSYAGKIGVAFGGGYSSTDKSAKVTKAKGRTIYELDGRPALEVYKEWTGKSQEEVAGMNLLGASLLAPFGIEEAGFYRIVHLASGNPDGSIGVFAEIPEGTEVRLMQTSVDKLIQDVGDIAREARKDMAKVEALILSHCAGRKVAIGDRIGEVVPKIKEAIGDAPFIGFFSFGEQGCLPNQANRHCNLMLSALAIGE